MLPICHRPQLVTAGSHSVPLLFYISQNSEFSYSLLQPAKHRLSWQTSKTSTRCWIFHPASRIPPHTGSCQTGNAVDGARKISFNFVWFFNSWGKFPKVHPHKIVKMGWSGNKRLDPNLKCTKEHKKLKCEIRLLKLSETVLVADKCLCFHRPLIWRVSQVD